MILSRKTLSRHRNKPVQGLVCTFWKIILIQRWPKFAHRLDDVKGATKWKVPTKWESANLLEPPKL